MSPRRHRPADVAPPPAHAAGPAFAGVLLLAMAFATFGALAIGILAGPIIDEFGITREQLGYVLSANVVVAALASPAAGRRTDGLGSRPAVAAVFGFAAVSFVILAAAPVYWVLLAGALIAAVGQSAGNPATNKLIAEHVPLGRRGFITGLKQSGAEVGLVIGGPLLPLAAVAFGWRVTFGIVAAVAVVCLLFALVVLPKGAAPDETTPAAAATRLPPVIGWLTGYGFLMGLAGAMTFFIPLYVEEGLDRTPEIGGLAVAVAGAAAFVARVLWAAFSDRGERHWTSLTLIAGLSVVGVGLLAMASVVPILLWIGVVVVGASTNAWNSVGMLAVMHEVAPAQVGRASGVVLLGFLMGLGVGPPVYGRTVDQTGSYDLLLLIGLVTVVAALALVCCWRWQQVHSSHS